MKKEQALKALAEGIKACERNLKAKLKNFVSGQQRELAWEKNIATRRARLINRLELGELYEVSKEIVGENRTTEHVLVRIASFGKATITLRPLAAPDHLSYPFTRAKATHLAYSWFISSSWKLKPVKTDALPTYLAWAWKSEEFERTLKGD